MTRIVGAVQLRDTGRSALLHGRACRPGEELHEYWVTELALVFVDSPMERGVKVARAYPDGVMVRDGHACAVEVDNSGKLTAKQYACKWQKYETFKGFILVVAHTEERMRRIVRWSEAVKEVALFSTFPRLAAGEGWVDWYGNTTRV